MAALCNRRVIIFLPCDFYLSIFVSSFFFSSPSLSGRRLDVYHNLHTWCGLSANLECMSETCCARLIENTGRKTDAKKFPSGHHRTTLSGYIFATKAYVDNRKKNLLNSIISSTCPHNMANFGKVAAEIGRRVWGTPANFNGIRILAMLLHGTRVLGVSQTLRRWTKRSTNIRQGGHHVGHWPTFLVICIFVKTEGVKDKRDRQIKSSLYCRYGIIF